MINYELQARSEHQRHYQFSIKSLLFNIQFEYWNIGISLKIDTCTLKIVQTGGLK